MPCCAPPRYILCPGHLPVPAAGPRHAQRAADRPTHAEPEGLQHPDPRPVLLLPQRHPGTRPTARAAAGQSVSLFCRHPRGPQPIGEVSQHPLGQIEASLFSFFLEDSFDSQTKKRGEGRRRQATFILTFTNCSKRQLSRSITTMFGLYVFPGKPVIRVLW